jgi:hypothetical protein
LGFFIFNYSTTHGIQIDLCYLTVPYGDEISAL